MASALPPFPVAPPYGSPSLAQPQPMTQAAMQSSFHLPANPDVRSSSFTSPSVQQVHPYGNMMNGQSSQHSQAASFRSSFNDSRMDTSRPMQAHKPQIYTAVYSSVAVYEMEVNGTAVMRRRADSWLNATQILKVAGVDKGRRTKIIEKEILPGHHEKVQGGYGKYQGTWINYQRGRDFCRSYGVEEVLRPLLEYDIASDGTGNIGKNDTPTKEQAMAANRKRFYNTGIDRSPNGTINGGTFFSNISPTASNALAAMNKAARFESPAPRPASAQRRPPSIVRQSSSQQQLAASQESVFPTSQQSFMSDHAIDPAMEFSQQSRQSDGRMEAIEPPRKKMRPSFTQEPSNVFDPMLQDDTPTEPNDSFMFSQEAPQSDMGPVSLQPLSAPSDKSSERKRTLLLDLFADSNRGDLSSHEAMTTLSSSDYDIPLDASANTALHWAATLARVSLIRLLIRKGANPFRGNAAGQTPLMAAVSVNNSWDQSCFPDMLELFGPLIEIRDATGRTVLHHIAVSSGIKGRAQSSRYYLESLLVFIVRQGSGTGASAQMAKPLTLGRFMADVVNVQDKSGNTALNLVARIGNRTIIDQLDELGADFNLPNNTGFKPTDFGVFPKSQSERANGLKAAESGSQPKSSSQIDQMKEELTTTLTSMILQATRSHGELIEKAQARIDSHQMALRNLAKQHNEELNRFEALNNRARARTEASQQIANLRKAIQELRAKGSAKASNGVAEFAPIDRASLGNLPVNGHGVHSLDQGQKAYLSSLGSAESLRARISAYSQQNSALRDRIASLQSRSIENEAMYRKVVSLCTDVEEDKVDSMLGGLVAAVESETSEGEGVQDMKRVREFLRRVETAEESG